MKPTQLNIHAVYCTGSSRNSLITLCVLKPLDTLGEKNKYVKCPGDNVAKHFAGHVVGGANDDMCCIYTPTD